MFCFSRSRRREMVERRSYRDEGRRRYDRDRVRYIAHSAFNDIVTINSVGHF